jgi:hypothetical protein
MMNPVAPIHEAITMSISAVHVMTSVVLIIVLTTAVQPTLVVVMHQWIPATASMSVTVHAHIIPTTIAATDHRVAMNAITVANQVTTHVNAHNAEHHSVLTPSQRRITLSPSVRPSSYERVVTHMKT